MSFAERWFWLVLTSSGAVFAEGLYLTFSGEPNRAGPLLMFVGVFGMAATLVETTRGPEASLNGLQLFVIIALVLNLAVLGYDIYDRHYGTPDYHAMQARWYNAVSTLPTTSGEEFADMTVNLDGRRFENCTVNGGTTLRFNGEKPFVFDCKMASKDKLNGRMIQILSDNPVVEQTMALDHNFELYIGGGIPICQTPEDEPGAFGSKLSPWSPNK